MSDHSPWPSKVRAYVLTVSAAGLLAIGSSGYSLATGRVDLLWLGFAFLTILSASVTIKIPALPARISISDTFVFTSLLVFGVPAATLTVAIDGLVASLWAFRGRPHRLQKTLFNTAAPSLALWATASLCFGLTGLQPVIKVSGPVQQYLAPLFVTAALYFALNSWLMATVIGFETGDSAKRIWADNFLWMAITHLGSASVAVLLVLLFNTPAYGPPMFGLIVPLLALFYLALRFVTARAEDEIAHLKTLKAAAEEKAVLEEQLREAHKMESVGRLAAGVAHDFNNLLAPIIGYAEMLQEDLRAGTPEREQVDQIRQAAERAKDLTRQLLAFGRKQLLSMSPMDLRSVLQSFERLIRRTLRADIQIAVVVPETPCPVRADTGQIEQVLLHLALNAQDAMPQGGRLTFTLSYAKIEPGDALARNALEPGEYVALAVADTGVGMDAETLSRVCEPFFTTKARGSRTGLGLSMVFGIVKQHGGHLQIESAPGLGTTVTAYLPRTLNAAAEHVAAAAGAPDAVESGRILVVEDNDAVRRMTTTALERRGYRVTAVGSGHEALAAVGNGNHAPYDLLLTDIILPDMNGRLVYERLAATRSGMRVLFMSGYADDVIADDGVLKDGVSFLQKPFTPQALVAKVRDALALKA